MASSISYRIQTPGASIEEIRRDVRAGVDCYFHETMERPGIIRLHFVRDDILVSRDVAPRCPRSRVPALRRLGYERLSPTLLP